MSWDDYDHENEDDYHHESGYCSHGVLRSRWCSNCVREAEQQEFETSIEQAQSVTELNTLYLESWGDNYERVETRALELIQTFQDAISVMSNMCSTAAVLRCLELAQTEEDWSELQLKCPSVEDYLVVAEWLLEHKKTDIKRMWEIVFCWTLEGAARDRALLNILQTSPKREDIEHVELMSRRFTKPWWLANWKLFKMTFGK